MSGGFSRGGALRQHSGVCAATWVEFYYHPTLNPFGLPPILSLFVAMVWLNLITALAVIDDVRRCLPVGAAVVYLMTLLGACVVLYLSFTLTVGLYVGYLLFAAYVVFALRRYLTRYYRPYRCGRCGKGLTHLHVPALRRAQ